MVVFDYRFMRKLDKFCFEVGQNDMNYGVEQQPAVDQTALTVAITVMLIRGLGNYTSFKCQPEKSALGLEVTAQ